MPILAEVEQKRKKTQLAIAELVGTIEHAIEARTMERAVKALKRFSASLDGPET